MFSFSSKYALALYEMVQKRGNLKFKTSEEFPLDRFRSLLGVEPNKLREFKHFKNRAMEPAVLEVNGLGEFGCKVEPIFSGRKVTAVRLSWWAKNLDERKSTLNELRFSWVGRRVCGTQVHQFSGIETKGGRNAPVEPRSDRDEAGPQRDWQNDRNHESDHRA